MLDHATFLRVNAARWASFGERLDLDVPGGRRVTLVHGSDARGEMVAGVGEPGDVARALLESERSVPTSRALLARGTVEALRTHPSGAANSPWRRLEANANWDWFYTRSPLAQQPGEEAVAPVTDLAEIEDVLAAAIPSTSVREQPERHEWLGWREADGALQAVVAHDRVPLAGGGFTVHLAGLGTRPEARGRGIGAALTSATVRRAFDAGAELVHFGMWSDNDGARRLYHRLGLRTGYLVDMYLAGGVTT